MAKAIVDGTIIAESETTETVEGNLYFPADSIKWEYFSETDQTTVCPWKGTANYFDVTVGETNLSGVAWVYNEPHEAASEIKGHLAFYPKVQIEQ